MTGLSQRFVFALCLITSQLHFSAGFSATREELISGYKKVLEPFQKKNPMIGQGNPATTKHPMTTEQCLEKAKTAGITFENPGYEKICGAPYMSPLFDPAKQKPEDAKVCIDQFEFPNIPCEYPVVWTQANEAVEICAAEGKRICDAHEWEGACAGDLQPEDYKFDSFKNLPPEGQLKARRAAHNAVANKNEVYPYGTERKKGICAMNSTKDNGCNGGDWKRCGSNTYPAGSFPECRSKFDVFDQNGNAAEHMNIPTKPEEMASANPLKPLGYTEMKGSWFIWDKYQAHPDHCRWRAPYWHGTKITDPKSHSNYHLSFRCCKDVK
ncbi:MAG: hypothetical protein EOP10_08265 [Proteobacteria bacterium]|nr:MAG: hypothetical protein EOP10_08265 [Pseudomonadota bacterium]